MIPVIRISDYSYDLTDDRIAKYPLESRDSSKLLVYKHGKIGERHFSDLPEEIPTGALLVRNETKVMPARMHFCRESGAHIEIFCLEPVQPSEYNLAFDAVDNCCWKCIVGNAKRWKGDILSLYNPDGDNEIASLRLEASLIERTGQDATVEFKWKGDIPFSKVLELCGRIPIPPYLNRESEDIDTVRYQTTYARIRGSVAAPTAGLHFTDEVFKRLRDNGVECESVCLHVGAGTFLPVKSELVGDHPMHREPFSVSRSLLDKLIQAVSSGREVVAVGTTSMRTLESLFYTGVSCIENGKPEDVTQWAPYERDYPYSTAEALEAIVRYLDANSLNELKIGTRIIIVPGFRFRIVGRLVTNFHQSESTLLLLIAAFVGESWRNIYSYALGHGFRFLSYGDSSVLERSV